MEWSYWERTAFVGRPDIVVVGGGITGLSTAIFLRARFPRRPVLLLERGTLPMGASTRNAGFACFGSPTELLADLANDGSDQVWQTVEMRWKGLLQLREMVGDDALNYRALGGNEIFCDTPDDQRQFDQVMHRLPDLNKQLHSITGTRHTFRVANDLISNFGLRDVRHLIHNSLEGQLHPGQLIRALRARARDVGVTILSGIGVTQLLEHTKGVRIVTDQRMDIQAERVFVATNGFATQLIPELDLQPARNQVMITRPIRTLRLSGTFHYQQGYIYFRNVGSFRFLIGGARHLDPEGERTDQFGNHPIIRQALLEFAERILLDDHEYSVDTWWSGILGVGRGKQPIVRRVSERIAVGVRLGGMGVAIGTMVSRQLAKL